MRLNRLLPGLSLVGALLLALPAEAARLQFWRFDTEANQLTFTTDDRIQPTAQLLYNPTRLVIDLPGTALITPETQTFEGAIKEIRTSELDTGTTRLVVEYNSGYTVDPSQLQVRGESARQWLVQLPDALSANSDSSPVADTAESSVTGQLATGSDTRIQRILATADGFFISTDGAAPQLEVSRSEENGQRYIILTFAQARAALGLRSRLPVNRYSVTNWQIGPVSDDPTSAQVTLALGETSPDWEISATPEGVVILPKDVSISSIPDEREETAEPAPTVAPTVTRTPPTPVSQPVPQPATPRQLAPDELPTLPNGRFTVVIDPGHGGRDPGAVGIGGLQEKVVVNDIAPQVAAILREQGANVVMTRDSDYELDLAPRVQIAERANATVFVSIHANAISLSRPEVNGLETFYASDAGQRFANTVHATVLNTMGMRDRRVRSARFYVIRQTSMPAILVETGFVTGAEDSPNLADPEWRSRMARAIAHGILLHLQNGV
ncbi:MAG: N-acetylmuramoyl-L-alanine amidase [Phormidesmis sp.]